MRKKLLYPSICLLFLTFYTQAQERVTKEFAGIEKISINTSSGDCILKKGSGTEVKVELEHDFGNGYEPVIEKEGNRLMIKEKFRGGSWSGSAKWTLTIPDNMDVRFNTGSGNFEASNLKFELDMNTGSGDIILASVKGDLRSNTGSGDVEISDFDGDMKANTGSGNMRLANSVGDVRLNCGSGNIRIKDTNAVISANVGSGDIDASGVTLAGSSSFNSGSGTTEVMLAATPKYDISVNSGSGDATLDFEGNKIEGLVVMKANKKNGRISAPFSFDTEEEIDNDSGRWSQTIIKKTVQLGKSDVQIKVSSGSGTAKISK